MVAFANPWMPLATSNGGNASGSASNPIARSARSLAIERSPEASGSGGDVAEDDVGVGDGRLLPPRP